MRFNEEKVSQLKNSKWVIVKINTNWADEMDLFGMIIIQMEELREYMNNAIKFFKDASELWIHCGSNQELLWESLDDYLDCFDINTITLKEKESLLSVFGENAITNKGKLTYSGYGGLGEVPFTDDFSPCLKVGVS